MSHIYFKCGKIPITNVTSDETHPLTHLPTVHCPLSTVDTVLLHFTTLSTSCYYLSTQR